jgi:ABC-type antimicrobial peptide transport system permease subunit
VARRTPEIGIRLAVGATRPEILRLILREALAVVALGLAGGAALTLVASRIAEGLLYGLAPDDPATIAVAGGVLGTVALAASAVPALRAARLDPTRTLRQE